MGNLYGLRCPECGGTDQIDVSVELCIRLTDTGGEIDATQGIGLHPSDCVSCGGCFRDGTLADFAPEELTRLNTAFEVRWLPARQRKARH